MYRISCFRPTRPSRQSFFLLGVRGVGKSRWARRQFPDALRIDLLDEGRCQDYLVDPSLFAAELASSPPGSRVVVDENRGCSPGRSRSSGPSCDCGPRWVPGGLCRRWRSAIRASRPPVCEARVLLGQPSISATDWCQQNVPSFTTACHRRTDVGSASRPPPMRWTQRLERVGAVWRLSARTDCRRGRCRSGGSGSGCRPEGAGGTEATGPPMRTNASMGWARTISSVSIAMRLRRNMLVECEKGS